MKKTTKMKEEDYKLKCKKESLELEHKLKMERLKVEKQNAQIFHNLALERERIKSAEIRKAQMRKGIGDPFRF